MRVVKGDLIRLAKQGEFDIIVHGCNCFHVMGSGIARQIAEEFPQAVEADKSTPLADPTKLGTLSRALVSQGGKEFWVVNAYTQYGFGERLFGRRDVEYGAVRSCMARLRQMASVGWTVGYPMIGAGLGGGDWAVISQIIDSELAGITHTLVEYDQTV